MKRRCTIAAAILLAACGGEEPVVRIADFDERSPRVACEQIEGPVPPAALVTALQPASESTFVLVDERAREVGMLDRSGRRLRTLALAEHGPLGVAQLADAVMLGDTLIVVADAGRNRLRAFTPAGLERWTLDIAFPPQRVAVAGGRVLVAAVGMDPRIPSLLYELSAAVLVPLRIPFATHPDALARMFMNSITLNGFPDGRAIVAHQFVVPRAWRLGPGRGAVQAAMPMPASAGSAVGFMPPMPLREEDLERIAAPVIASTADASTGGVLYLTRSGSRRDGRSEKALIRVDSALNYVASVRLDMNAVAVATVAMMPDSVLIVDDGQKWHRCPAPFAAVAASR